MLMKATQARPGELLGLRVSDFNLAYDPPYFNISAERAKSDMPRELFFSNETKQMLISYIERNGKKANDFLFLNNIDDPMNEELVQWRIMIAQRNMTHTFRYLLSSPEFADMNQLAKDGSGAGKRYKIHIYSFKKFAFTVMADTLGEIAARAIKGDKEYVLTYYRKSREERAEDYRKVTPKLCVFEPDEASKLRDDIRESIDGLDRDTLQALQEFLKTAKGLPVCS